MGRRENTLEERTSEFSTSVQKTFRDLVTLSMDLLCTDKGHTLIRKKIEDTGKEFEDKVNAEILSRTGEKKPPREVSGDFQKKKIRIDWYSLISDPDSRSGMII